MGSLLYYFVIRFVGFWEKIFAGFHDTLPLFISGGGGDPSVLRSFGGLNLQRKDLFFRTKGSKVLNFLFRMILN